MPDVLQWKVKVLAQKYKNDDMSSPNIHIVLFLLIKQTSVCPHQNTQNSRLTKSPTNNSWFLVGKYRNGYHQIRNISLCDFLYLLLPYHPNEGFSFSFSLRTDSIFRTNSNERQRSITLPRAMHSCTTITTTACGNKNWLQILPIAYSSLL